MISVVQRVTKASLNTASEPFVAMDHGLVVLVGFEEGDPESMLELLALKIIGMRIFPDEQGKMNRSVVETGGRVLVVPNFTLAANLGGGRRPNFDTVMPPVVAERFYRELIACFQRTGTLTLQGHFGAHMSVGMENDGPVTLVITNKTLGIT